MNIQSVPQPKPIPHFWSNPEVELSQKIVQLGTPNSFGGHSVILRCAGYTSSQDPSYKLETGRYGICITVSGAGQYEASSENCAFWLKRIYSGDVLVGGATA